MKQDDLEKSDSCPKRRNVVAWAKSSIFHMSEIQSRKDEPSVPAEKPAEREVSAKS